MAPAITEFYAQWGESWRWWEFGTELGVGTGKQNTQNIVNHSVYSGNTDAAQLCANLIVINDNNVFDDWFLPSLGELILMYANLHLNNIGEFYGCSYWSSSESNHLGAVWKLGFTPGGGSPVQYWNCYPNFVRAIRQF